MNPQKHITLFKKKILNHNKKFKFFRFLSSKYSNCHTPYGDFNDKENIN